MPAPPPYATSSVTAGPTTPRAAPGLTNTTAAARARDGAIDTDVNAADFVTGTPTPTDAAGAGGGGAGGGDVPGLRIHDIQAAAHTSPYVGKRALSVPGIATAVGATQFWLQDGAPDARAATSEGINVYAGAKPTVAVGDSVTVTGTVSEFRPGGRGGASNLTTTELSAPHIKVAAHGLPVPPARVVGPGGRVPPKRAIETVAGDVDTSSHFDPARAGIDFWESLEGMRVELDDAQVVGPTNSYGETVVVPRRSSVRTERGGIVAQSGDVNPERVVVAGTLTPAPTATVGDSYAGATVGVLDYAFGNYELLPTSSPTLHTAGSSREAAVATPGGQLSVATFNVENLAPSNSQTKFDRLAAYAVTNLASPRPTRRSPSSRLRSPRPAARSTRRPRSTRSTIPMAASRAATSGSSSFTAPTAAWPSSADRAVRRPRPPPSPATRQARRT